LFLKSLPQDAILALESTGGYGTLLANMACAKGFTVYMVQPNKVRNFRKSSPMRSKTDKNDAIAIHDYILAHKRYLHPYQPLPAFEARLRTLARVREGLSSKLVSILSMLRALGDNKKEIEATTVSLRKRIARIDSEIECMIAGALDSKLIMSIPGVKKVVLSFVLPVLRTIPFASKHAFVSYVGLDLVMNESGQFKGRRSLSKQGDRHIRRAIYMAAMAASRSKAFKDYYQKLLNEKKLTKIQALVALARKLLRVIYGVYRSGKTFVAHS
jgi:transposase